MKLTEQIQQMKLQSEKVFAYFEELAAFPHGSGNTKKISDYLVAFAKAHGLEYYQDKWNNVVMIKEASAGYENEEPVILQGHMDMVCEKESGCPIDFTKDGLDLYIDGDFLKARGTTLGGDDGIAVAYALAILDSPDIVHPRLEVVITSDEEIGLLGASAIDVSMLNGHRMLNIDSDIEGHFLTSCAGGMRAKARIPVSYIEKSGLSYQVKITGLSGGHSGSEIDKEHANANLLMGRLLKYLADRMEIGIGELFGGSKDNAIPRESEAILLLDEADETVFTAALQEMEAILKKEYSISDAGVSVVAEKQGRREASALSWSSMSKILLYLRSIPDGVQHMSRIMPGLVETSLNLGIMKLSSDEFTTTTSVRSSVATRKEEIRDKLAFFVEFLGGELEISGDYPAWEYTENSMVRKKIDSIYRELFQEEPIFEAIHAGLECGIFSGKIKGLDCVSFGPNNFDIHTPNERLSISSTEKVWKLLVTFLKERQG